MSGELWRNDPVERIVGEALEEAGIDFGHEVQVPVDNGLKTIDFELDNGLLIEVCQMWTPRKIRQLEGIPNIILIQGKEAARQFAELLDVTYQAPEDET